MRLMPSDPRYQQADAIQRGLMALTNAHTLGEWERVDMGEPERMAAMGELERAWYDLEWGRFLETVGD